MSDPTIYPVIVNIVKTLLPKTRRGQAAWQTDGEVLTLRLPVALVSLKPIPKEPGTDYEMWLSQPDGRQLGLVAFTPQDQNYPAVRELYTSATKASWELIEREIQRMALEEEIIGLSVSTPSPSPSLPIGPTVQQAEDFFNRIQGEWHLEFSRGQEDCRIDTDGKYFRLRTRQATTAEKPAFHLELLASTSNFERVEIAKVELNGRTRQIEVLDVTQNEMIGYAKHDRHSLKYTRR